MLINLKRVVNFHKRVVNFHKRVVSPHLIVVDRPKRVVNRPTTYSADVAGSTSEVIRAGAGTRLLITNRGERLGGAGTLYTLVRVETVLRR